MGRNKVIRAICAALSAAVIMLAFVPVAEAVYIKRYTTIANGGMTYTGNTMGLSKQSNANAPGTAGSIGDFITTNTALRDGTYPYGTTANWQLNSSSAQLRIPGGSTILYAELIWGGSYRYGGENVSASLNGAVTLATPGGGSFSVSPDPSTAAITGGSEYYYVRSADVTSYVQSAGAGTYTVGGVPGTQSSTENNANAAGWTLAVIYGNPSLPSRNMTVFVGAELTSSSTSPTSSVSGFCTPTSGTINARMMVSAIEGDSDITGDRMLFGPTTATMAAVSGPRNPLNNFFASQINKDDGTLDTAGTFGSLNHTPGTNGSGRRQGWDITNIDVSSRMQSNQSTAYARGSTTGDRYTITSIGLQVNVGSPVFPSAALTVDKTQTYIGDTLTYTATLDNRTGTADALNVVYTDGLPLGTSFVTGSFTIDGAPQAGANPVSGAAIGTVAAGTMKTVTYKVTVNSIPLPPAAAEFRGTSSWAYQYQSCAGFPINNGTLTTNTTVTGTPRLQPTKTASPPGKVLPGGTVTYTVSIPNTGTANSSGTTLSDPIPAGTTYVPNSTYMNGTLVSDVGGQMPFAAARLVNSPGEPTGQINIGETATVSFQVTINPDPPLIIANTATVDPDGAGPAPPITVSITNPPVQADLAVAATDNQTTVTAGTAVTYLVTVTNNGPDAVIGFNLSMTVPPSITSVTYTPAAGAYNSGTGQWTGLNLAAGQSVVLSVAGTLSPAATGTVTVSVTVAPSPGVLDSNSANNTASDTDTIALTADLAITKTDGKTVVAPGTNITYTITVTNNGPSTVTSMTVVDTLPPVFQGPLFTPAQGIYNETTGLWTGLNLGPGQSVTLTLNGTVDPSASGAVVNTVTVSPPSGVTDPNLANNTATDTNYTGAVVTLTKSVDKATAAPGEELTYAVHYKNTGGSEAKSLIIIDEVNINATYVAGSLRLGSAGSTYATATPKTDAVDADEGSVSGTTITFSINAVAADDGVANSGSDEGKTYFKLKIK